MNHRPISNPAPTASTGVATQERAAEREKHQAQSQGRESRNVENSNIRAGVFELGDKAFAERVNSVHRRSAVHIATRQQQATPGPLEASLVSREFY